MRFLRDVLGFLAKLALFFLVLGVILGFVIAEYAHAAEAWLAAGDRDMPTLIAEISKEAAL